MTNGRASSSLNNPLAAARAAFVDGFARGDVTSACAVYTDDARLLAPSAELVQGREAIERFWQAGIDSGITAVGLDVLEVARGVGLAYETGRYALWLDDDAAAEHGAYVLVHERQRDGTWRRAVEMFNPETETEERR
jgi:ketosteroid isomerase-like protein